MFKSISIQDSAEDKPEGSTDLVIECPLWGSKGLHRLDRNEIQTILDWTQVSKIIKNVNT